MPRTLFEKLSSVQMLDVSVSTTDGRQLLFSRRTEPREDVRLLLSQLELTLPVQPSPRIQNPNAIT